MFTPTLRCECAQPASDRLMRKWCIGLHVLYIFSSLWQTPQSVRRSDFHSTYTVKHVSLVQRRNTGISVYIFSFVVDTPICAE